MAKNLVYDYYQINLPGDLFDANDKDAFERQAVNEARERAKLYVMPCNWRVGLISGTLGESHEVTYRVVRIRRKPQKAVA